MKIDAQEYLSLVEQTGRLVFVDIEGTGLRGDYSSVLVVSVKPYGEKPESDMVDRPGDDRGLVRRVRDRLEQASCWVTYYGKGFDIPMLNTRLLRHKTAPIEKRPHIDMYFTLKSKILTARKSQGHLLDWLDTPEKKMSVSAEMWNKIMSDTDKHMPQMVRRCESDVAGLEALYRRTKHLIGDITR